MTQKDLYEMELHEENVIDQGEEAMITVMRVLGGWIYKEIMYDDGLPFHTSSIFVPEPKNRKKKVSK
jgi:hypothetical protein